MNANRLFENIKKLSLIQKRTYIKDPPLPEGGIKYHGFTYYPRKPDFKDPPYEPTRLFLVTRLTKNMKGLNPVERKTLEVLNIDGEVKKDQHRTIVKNIPEINSHLWKVKHLVKITPIRFVNGLPKDGNLKGTFLRDNGEFTILTDIDPKRVKAYEDFVNNKRRLDGKTLKYHLKVKWESALEGDV